MSPRKLSLEIVTPEGATHVESDLDGIVVRRREDRSPGSELLVMPLHGPMLARIEPCTMRIYSKGTTRYLDVEGGFLEVKNDHVTLVTTGHGERPGAT